jgi:hypothetical protein
MGKGGKGPIGTLKRRDINQSVKNGYATKAYKLEELGLKFAPSKRFTTLRSASRPSSALRDTCVSFSGRVRHNMKTNRAR